MNINQLLAQLDIEEKHSLDTLHLSANESAMSKTAQKYLTSDIANRYFFGRGDDDGVVDFGPSTYRGLSGVQGLVDEASDFLRTTLGAGHVSLSPVSGVHAMMCAILAATDPGDAIMCIDIAHGGHFSTKNIIERTGRRALFTQYDFRKRQFDIKKIGHLFREYNAKAIYLDSSYYIEPHNLYALRAELGTEAVIIYDASHTLGLIIGGYFQNPFAEGADIICANTHKTLPGPQKGIVMIKDQAKDADKIFGIINDGLYSSPHTGTMIALAITILEMNIYGEEYAKAMINNSSKLAQYLLGAGYKLRRTSDGSFSKNHQVHLMTNEIGNYRDLYRSFSQNNISVHFSDTLGGDMFIRLGTQEITRKGMEGNDMQVIAKFIDASLRGRTDLGKEVSSFNAKFKSVKYSFDEG